MINSNNPEERSFFNSKRIHANAMPTATTTNPLTPAAATASSAAPVPLANSAVMNSTTESNCHAEFRIKKVSSSKSIHYVSPPAGNSMITSAEKRSTQEKQAIEEVDT
jgi:hypothetical protein